MTQPGDAGTMEQLRGALHTEVSKVVVGQGATVDGILAAMSVGGHLLLEGPPGVAKSLLATAVGQACGLKVRRVQFTPDLLPSDLTGSMILRGSEMVFREGPLFANVLLADELNRTPPKTQAALLESMQEGQVTVDGVAHPLPDPFIVLATENPIEYEGTYPLPEAQLDRFLMKLTVSYPSAADEEVMLSLGHRGVDPATLSDVRPIGDARLFARLRDEVDRVTVTQPVVHYVSSLVRRTREIPSVSLGASPRAAVHLLAASKAWARLCGRSYVIPDDVSGLAPAVLRHRLILTPEAELDRVSPEQALQTVLASVPVPR
jgi:MoxR-like ATPase